MSASGSLLLAQAVARRLVRFFALLLGALIFVEALLWAAPGDAIDLLPNGHTLRPALSEEWGLSGSLPARVYGRLTAILTGDLGESIAVRPGASVSALTAQATARSAGILFPALVLSTMLAVLCSSTGSGRSRWFSWGVSLISAAPVFLLAWGLVSLLNEGTHQLLEAGWIHRPRWFSLPLVDHPLRSAVAIVILAIGSGALSTAYTALSVVVDRLLRGPMVSGLRARGTPTGPHLRSNLRAPLAAVVADRLAFLLGGLVVVETVLLRGGAGSLLWQAALKRDVPLAAGLTLVAAGVVAGGRLLLEVFQLVVDPRLREGP